VPWWHPRALHNASRNRLNEQWSSRSPQGQLSPRRAAYSRLPHTSPASITLPRPSRPSARSTPFTTILLSRSSLSQQGLARFLLAQGQASRPKMSSPGPYLGPPNWREPSQLVGFDVLGCSVYIEEGSNDLSGPFRIYRAPGSVAFLSCGSALQPILPKSQAWCVDESSSKFVLQIRRPQYWRIEIPVGSTEDAQRAQLLREVFDQILQFEKTECPFKRTFTVDLPEPPSTPIKKRPWTPVKKPSVSLPPTPVTPGDITRAKRFAEEDPASGPASPSLQPSSERNEPDITESPILAPSEEEEANPEGKDNDETNEEKEPEQDHEASPTVVANQGPLRAKVADLRGFYSSRCVTAPPQLMLDSSGPTKPSSEMEVEEPAAPIEGDQKSESPASHAESHDSFHSPQSFLSTPPLPPSPPQSSPPSPVASPSHGRSSDDHEETGHEDRSDITIVSNLSQEPWSASPTTSAPSESSGCATMLSSVCDVDCPQPSCDGPATPSDTILENHPLKTSMSNISLSSSLSRSSSGSTARRPAIRHRATTSSSISPSRRALSPLPPAVNLFSPRPTFKMMSQKTTLAAVRRLPMAVIQKACEVLMSPPSHLINLMLKVAARIAAGEWRGLVFGVDERGEQIPVQWDWSEEEDSHVDGGRFIDEDWPPRGSGRRMAGSFPESDDEDDWSADQDGELTAKGESDWSRSLGVD